ncbi:MAG TPA: hypothetical protein VIV11_12775 [Kofleriaceae bacterium]
MIRALAIAFVVAACSGPQISGTACNDDKDCNLFNAQGRCESTGWCSFPDETCASGHRYSPGAGDGFGNACVDGAATCGAKDQACCGTGVCGANLTCATEVGTCQCGASGQPCCDGTMCGTGLFCGAGAVCGSSEVLQAAVGAGHACVLFTDNSVACWGYDWKPFAGVPGKGDSVIASARPTAIAGANDIVELRAAEMHTCGRKLDGTLWCWGHNEDGQLGNAMNANSKVAVQVSGLSNVTLFDGGRTHTCALGTFNTMSGLWCWGRGGEGNPRSATQPTGKLGNNSSADSNVPVKVDLTTAAAMGQTVKSLSTGAYHSCIVMSDNKTWCWGRNANGELGNGTTTPSKVPVEVGYAAITIPSGVTVDQVSCSDGRRKQGSTCILLSNGTVYCWGANSVGELGDGTTATTPRMAPSTAVNTSGMGGVKIVQIVAAQFAKCARTDDASIWCWGQNKNGIIGIDDPMQTNHPMPVKVNVLSTVTHVDMSHRLVCAVDSAKQLYCWGTNRRGQALAIPPTTESEGLVLQPTRVMF